MIESVIISKLASAIFEKWLVPKFAEILDDAESSGREKIVEFWNTKFKNNFKEYLKIRYKRLSIVDSVVFPNQQINIKDIYVPIELRHNSASINPRKFEIDEFPAGLFDKVDKVVIVDQAGMGKSTVVKWIFLKCVDDNQMIPLLIDLSSITNKNSFIDEIHNQINPIENSIEKDLLKKVLQNGNFLIILDGLDEVKNSEKEFVNKGILDLVNSYYGNKYILTTRPENDTTSLFGEFLKFSISPLTIENSKLLLRKYDKYNHHKIAEALISSVEIEVNKPVKEFLKNPLLTSLLYRAYDYKKDVPLRKTEFYRQVFESLFESHDLTKEGYLRREKYSNLFIDKFESIIRFIAFRTSVSGEFEYTKNRLLKIISDAKKYTGQNNFEASDYLKDLLVTVPLLKREGTAYKWMHKSIQDYFSAKFIWLDLHEDKNSLFIKLYATKGLDRFYNILDILYDLDVKYFIQNIGIKFFKDAINYYDSFQDERPTDAVISVLFNMKTYFIILSENNSSDYSKAIIDKDRPKGNNVATYVTSTMISNTYYKFNYDTFPLNANIRLIGDLLANKKHDSVLRVKFNANNVIDSFELLLNEFGADNLIEFTSYNNWNDGILTIFMENCLFEVLLIDFELVRNIISHIESEVSSKPILDW